MITDEQIETVTELLLDSDLCQEDVLKALVVYEQSKWVSVKDRLPEPDKTVLIRYGDGSYDITHRKLNGLCDWSGVTLHDIVTHWQSIPEFKE